ncbi:hypothetical protein OIU74_006497 [Salix koriyanagi]|uniref:RING-CH-type domain-containing protein n=1 Tax=Salix koriyanagi TaxID=2511006 RepID=A0A9Q0UEA5_9ROSI|nr:hypothetical protein OIU74_006497 [Salix koriyanagi]
MDLIQLGCRCKHDLGFAHLYCAEAWFKLKGNRICEICGVTAVNITGWICYRISSMVVRFLDHPCGNSIVLPVWSEHSRLRVSLVATWTTKLYILEVVIAVLPFCTVYHKRHESNG